MKPPYNSMRTATALTYATIPCRLLKMIAGIPAAVWVFRGELFGRDAPLRWLVWLGVGAGLHLCLIIAAWVIHRSIDLSMLNPWTYSDWGWLLTVAWYCGCVWMWVNE